MGMGKSLETPLAWHLKVAMVLAGQLPDNPRDARIILQAVQDLQEHFLSHGAERPPGPSNVLPFAG